VLDVGCGRGVLLIGAARRLTTGKAIGADVWVSRAVSGNRPEAALENAAREGVADRVEVKHGDARQLPFADASFDVAVSNFVLHELNSGAEREQMAREIVRALKPGGHLALADFTFTAHCMQALRSCGVSDARRLPDSFLSFWITAILSLGTTQVYFVTGTKPLSAPQPHPV
jgi:arsenite methyltransferase